jgi:hypothetical protein
MTEDIEYIYQLFYKSGVKIKEKEKKTISEENYADNPSFYDKSGNKLFRHDR